MEKYKPITVIFTKIDTLNLSKLHISLLILLKSELNMMEKLKIFIFTTKNVLLELNSHIEIPINLEDFNFMINYALTKLKIKDEKGLVLLSVVKNKINEYLAPNTYKLRLDVKGQIFKKINEKYALFINLDEDEDEDMEVVRLSDYKMDKIGISGKIINIFDFTI